MVRQRIEDVSGNVVERKKKRTITERYCEGIVDAVHQWNSLELTDAQLVAKVRKLFTGKLPPARY